MFFHVCDSPRLRLYLERKLPASGSAIANRFPPRDGNGKQTGTRSEKFKEMSKVRRMRQIAAHALQNATLRPLSLENTCRESTGVT